MAGSAAIASSVIEMLKADHEKVKGLFERFERTEGQMQADVAATAIMELKVHADLEEKLIYPAIREHLDDEVINEAVAEHHLVHILIKELKALNPKDEAFQAIFKVLGKVVQRHIEEEEGEILPKAQKGKIDWEKLETAVMKRQDTVVDKLTQDTKPFSKHSRH
jgi:hemerythrin superfamily protein